MDRTTKAVVVTLCVVGMLAGIVELWAGWVAPSSRSYGELIDAPIWNQDVVDNTTYLKAVLDTTVGATVTAAGTQGQILYDNGSAWVALGTGTSGHYLKTQGAGANPVWAAVGGGVPAQVSGGYVSRASQALRYDIDQGNYVWLYESDAWAAHTIPSVGVTVNVSPTALAASSDCYAYVRDLNADGEIDTLNVTTTAPTTQDGITVCTGYTDFLVVARCYTNASSGIDAYNDNIYGTGTPRVHHIANYYNRRPISLFKATSGSSWTYQGSWHPVNNDTDNMVSFVTSGKSQVTAKHVNFTSGAANNGTVGVAVDAATTTNSASTHGSTFTGQGGHVEACYSGVLAAGRHYLTGLEGTYDNTSGAITFRGTGTGGAGGVGYLYIMGLWANIQE